MSVWLSKWNSSWDIFQIDEKVPGIYFEFGSGDISNESGNIFYQRQCHICTFLTSRWAILLLHLEQCSPLLSVLMIDWIQLGLVITSIIGYPSVMLQNIFNYCPGLRLSGVGFHNHHVQYISPNTFRQNGENHWTFYRRIGQKFCKMVQSNCWLPGDIGQLYVRS